MLYAFSIRQEGGIKTLDEQMTVASTEGMTIFAEGKTGFTSLPSKRNAKREEMLQGVCWMLTHGLLVQLQRFIYCTLPPIKDRWIKYISGKSVYPMVDLLERFVIIS